MNNESSQNKLFNIAHNGSRNCFINKLSNKYLNITQYGFVNCSINKSLNKDVNIQSFALNITYPCNPWFSLSFGNILLKL